MALFGLPQPSLEPDWSPDDAVLATAEIGAESVTIRNVRNISYRTKTDYDVHYYDKTFDLAKLESVWYMVEPFGLFTVGTAHTLVSFGFSDGEYVAISVEIRKKRGKQFSRLKSILRPYRLHYVIADERDVIGLRTNYRHHAVYLYPMQASKGAAHRLFISMLERANALATTPEYFNLFTNNCTTNLVAHVNALAPGRIPRSFRIALPAYSDTLAQQIGLIDQPLSIKALRARYHINERALRYAEDPHFSERIRGL